MADRKIKRRRARRHLGFGESLAGPPSPLRRMPREGGGMEVKYPFTLGARVDFVVWKSGRAQDRKATVRTPRQAAKRYKAVNRPRSVTCPLP